MNLTRTPWVTLGLALGLAGATSVPGSPSVDHPHWSGEQVLDFLDRHCYECHDSLTTKGDFDIEPLYEAVEIANAKQAVVWDHVLDQLNLGEMPPPDKPQPEAADTLAVVDWITSRLHDFHTRNLDGESHPGLRRINQTEYRNAIRDLLGVDFEPGERFPADETKEGFDKVGPALRISTPLFARYLKAAEDIAEKAVVTGPKPARQAQKSSGKKIDCELGLRRDGGGIEIASNREARARVFPVEPVGYEGEYRVRFHVTPVRSKGKKLTVRLKTGLADKELTIPLKQVDAFSLTEPTEFETMVSIPAGETVHLSFANGAGIPTTGQQRKYKGPAVVIDWIEVDGPIVAEWPPPGHRRLFAEGTGNRDRADARAILTSFAHRAFRRSPTEEMLAPLVATYDDEIARGETFPVAIRSAVKLALCSPHFLFVGDRGGEADDDRKLRDFALAERLAFFLWSSVPDEPLLAAAAAGRLSSDRAVLRREADRMIADPKFDAFLESFVGQWLRVREVGAMQPDPRLFPTYDEALGEAMREETRRFIGHLIEEDLPIDFVLNSDFTFLNERLARHYGIAGVKGDQFRRVSLQPQHRRGGVLGHASILNVTSNGTNTSPVVRGIFVLENILGTPPPEPPPDVEPIEPDTRGATTIREQLAKHRESVTCFDCHQRIDPLGLALEGFDPIGAWRTHYKLPGNQPRQGKPVDTSATTRDGQKLAGADDLRKYLMGRRDFFAKGLAEKLIIYSTGREPHFLDREAAAQLVMAEKGETLPGFRTLLLDLVQSEAFRRR